VGIESEFVDQAVELMFRLRRVKNIEADLINLDRHRMANDRSPGLMLFERVDTGKKWLFALEGLLGGTLVHLNRYETHLQRRLAAVVKQIQALQKARLSNSNPKES
jgi:hypothetical protein